MSFINPETGRKIRIGGSTHKELLWKYKCPYGKNERLELMNKCKNTKCFLDPNTLSYPICSKVSYSIDNNKLCVQDCSGLLSAYRRSKQYHNNNISNEALKIAKKNKCKWAK